MNKTTGTQTALALATDNWGDSSNLKQKLASRHSKELVIAFSGPIGCGISTTIRIFEERLKSRGYVVESIKLSSGIQELSREVYTHKRRLLPTEYQDFNFAALTSDRNIARYKALQDLGNFLRQTFELNVLAQYAISEITTKRIQAAKRQFDTTDGARPAHIGLAAFATNEFSPQRTAYIIDQVKHPAEVELLRYVYGDIFYLIGNLAIETERKRHLTDLGFTESDASALMERDKSENEMHGQQLERSLKLADYFIQNLQDDVKGIGTQADRFLSLIHRSSIETPTSDERGMYIAHSAALQSACLSRQVGACIIAKSGEMLATGCNDVPSPGGGLYSHGSAPDLRCFNKGGKCYNDHHKGKILDAIGDVLRKHEISAVEEIVEEIGKASRIRSLIEFSRSVHAEMNAITSIARSGGISTQGSTLYTTTFPCHNCARHIIAAGISRVVYIEPYEKSLAIELHDDAISLELPSDQKVVFTHFVGVSPRRYQDFFLALDERKDKNGVVINRDEPYINPQIHELLDSYRQLETKVTEHLKELGLIS